MILRLKRSTLSTTAMWKLLKYDLQHAEFLLDAELIAQVREVFQELGLQENTLDEAVAHVSKSDTILMAFMKVPA